PRGGRPPSPAWVVRTGCCGGENPDFPPSPAAVSLSPCTRRAKRSAARRGSPPPTCPLPSGPPIESSDAPARPLSVPASSRSPATTACGRRAPSSFEFVIVLSFLLLAGPSERVAVVDAVYRALPREPPRASAPSHARRSRKRRSPTGRQRSTLERLPDRRQRDRYDARVEHDERRDERRRQQNPKFRRRLGASLVHHARHFGGSPWLCVVAAASLDRPCLLHGSCL